MTRLMSAVRFTILCAAAAIVLGGCGQATRSDAQPESATDPTSVSTAESPTADSPASSAAAPQPSDQLSDQLSDLPQWPAACRSRSVVSVDYGRMPQGYASPEEAVAHAGAADIPDGTPMLAPGAATGTVGSAQVWVVDPQSDKILAQVSVFRGPDGWFVDSVMTCSRA
jgi:hypothetical protein